MSAYDGVTQILRRPGKAVDWKGTLALMTLQTSSQVPCPFPSASIAAPSEVQAIGSPYVVLLIMSVCHCELASSGSKLCVFPLGNRTYGIE